MSIIHIVKFITRHPLNKGRIFAALVHFLKWQIGMRFLPGALVYNWIQNSKFIAHHGEAGLTGNIYSGLHDFSDMGFLLHFLRANDLFIDIGANAGSYTILAGSVVGAKCVAVEPLPGTFARLVDNVRINNIENNVNCLNIGLSNSPGMLSFTSNMDTTNHALAPGESINNSVNIEVSTLDLVLNNECPQLIKLDVEGFETHVLQGGFATMQNSLLKAVIMEINGCGNRYGFDDSSIIEMMLRHGFRTYTYNPLCRQLIDLKGEALHVGNTLFIRDVNFVSDRLSSAPKFEVNGIHL